MKRLIPLGFMFLLMQICHGHLSELIVKIEQQRARLNSAGSPEYVMMFGTVTPFTFHLDTSDSSTLIKKIYLYNVDTLQTTAFKMGAPLKVSKLSNGKRQYVIFENELIMPESETRKLTAGKYKVGVLADFACEYGGHGSSKSKSNSRLSHDLWGNDTLFELYLSGDDLASAGLSFKKFPPALDPQRYLPSHYIKKDSFLSPQYHASFDKLLHKWHLSFNNRQNVINMRETQDDLHYSFASLKGREFIDGGMIESILKQWQMYQSMQIKVQVEFLPPEFIFAPIHSDTYIKIREHYLPSIDYKLYYMMPFNVGKDHHWYLMVYNVPYRKFVIVDSNNDLKNVEYYLKDIAVFSYILTNFIGVRGVPQSMMYDIIVPDDGWSRRLKAIEKNDYEDDDPFYKVISIWRSGYVQSDKDGYNCAIYTILHALYLAENSLMLNYITMRPDISINKSIVQDFGSVYRTNIFAVLGAICEFNLIRNGAPKSPVLNFPDCIGVHDSYISFLR